jgi:hypothetical protein
MPSPRGHIALVCVSAVALGAPTLTFAENGPPPPPPPSTPSINQYVETVPTSSGGWSEVGGSTRSKPLSPRVTKHLQQQKDPLARRLGAVATSSAYGAPQRKFSPPPQRHKTELKPSTPANPLRAAISAVNDSSDSHIYLLLAAIIVVTTTMVWAAARRHAE